MDIDAFARDGYAIAPAFAVADVVAALRERAMTLEKCGALVPAAVGRGDLRSVRADVRGDRIAWLDEAAPHDTELNAALCFGLWDFEAHYALYPPGAFYARHRDRFASEAAGAPSRVVSFVLYLNERWQPSDGGALRIHVDGERHVDVLPRGGTLACFLAERFDHEVLPATRPRLAVTGWLRRRRI